MKRARSVSPLAVDPAARFSPLCTGLRSPPDAADGSQKQQQHSTKAQQPTHEPKPSDTCLVASRAESDEENGARALENCPVLADAAAVAAPAPAPPDTYCMLHEALSTLQKLQGLRCEWSSLLAQRQAEAQSGAADAQDSRALEDAHDSDTLAVADEEAGSTPLDAEARILEAWNTRFHERATRAQTALELLAVSAERGDKASLKTDGAAALFASARAAYEGVHALLRVLRCEPSAAARSALLLCELRQGRSTALEDLLLDARVGMSCDDFVSVVSQLASQVRGLSSAGAHCTSSHAALTSCPRSDCAFPCTQIHMPVSTLYNARCAALALITHAPALLDGSATAALSVALQRSVLPRCAEIVTAVLTHPLFVPAHYADMLSRQLNSRSAISCAAMSDDPAVVRAFVSFGQQCCTSGQVHFVLGKAVIAGKTAIVTELLRDPRVADFSDIQYLNHSLLEKAAHFGHADTVRVLLDSPLVRTEHLLPALRAASTTGSVSAVRALLGRADINPARDKHLALRNAARAGHADVITALLEHPRSYPTTAAVFSAVTSGNAQALRALLADARVKPAALRYAHVGSAFEHAKSHVVQVLLADARFDVLLRVQREVPAAQHGSPTLDLSLLAIAALTRSEDLMTLLLNDGRLRQDEENFLALKISMSQCQPSFVLELLLVDARERARPDALQELCAELSSWLAAGPAERGSRHWAWTQHAVNIALNRLSTQSTQTVRS